MRRGRSDETGTDVWASAWWRALATSGLDEQGELLRELTLDPGRDYQPRGTA